jgi:hypothetical protein
MVMLADPSPDGLSGFRLILGLLAAANAVSLVALKVQHPFWDGILGLALVLHLVGAVWLIVAITRRNSTWVRQATVLMGVGYLLAGVNNVAWGFMSGTRPTIVAVTLFVAVIVAGIMMSAMWMLGPRILDVWEGPDEPPLDVLA